MDWIYILIAGLLEIVWIIGLKYSHGFTEFIPSVLTVGVIIIVKSFTYNTRGNRVCYFYGFGYGWNNSCWGDFLGRVYQSAKNIFCHFNDFWHNRTKNRVKCWSTRSKMICSRVSDE